MFFERRSILWSKKSLVIFDAEKEGRLTRDEMNEGNEGNKQGDDAVRDFIQKATFVANTASS